YCSLVRALYHSPDSVPYHNYFHALCVAQLAYLLLRDAKLLHEVRPIEFLAVILGSLGHDAGHRGFTNQFEVSTKSDLALRYNDLSVLENHHASISWGSIVSAGVAVVPPKISPTLDRFRLLFVSGIINTDMKFHGEHIQKAHHVVKYCQDRDAKVGDEDIYAPDEDEDDDTTQDVCELFLHLADIGNMVTPLKQSVRWKKIVLAEFESQAIAETKLGLPISMFPDGLDTPIKRARTQVGFLNYVVMPLFNVL
ncbi:unnamed protein product, partial [Amoebophrya sp. A25]